MQHRLQQASINDREKRLLLSQLELQAEAQKALVIIQTLLLKWSILFVAHQNLTYASTLPNTMIQATSNTVSLFTRKLYD